MEGRKPVKTTSVNIMNLCVPCENRCRYCLLSWDGRLSGVEYARGVEFARRFYDWAKKNRPELMLTFGFGYSMEHPKLLEAIDFMHTIGSPTGEFLQFNGMKLRNPVELRDFLRDIQAHGVELIDLTFYGTRDYHDRFSARAGDFDFLLEVLRQANAIGLPVEAGIPLTRENAGQADTLIAILMRFQLKRLFCFIPHQEGRGIRLNKVRFRHEDYVSLSQQVKQHLNTARYRPEGQWLAERQFSVPRERALYLSLTGENMAFFEALPFADTVAYLEKLDEDYYQVIPPMEQLAAQYGEPENEEYYSQQDLSLKYQYRYIADHELKIYDIHDERQCGSRRF